MAMLAMSMSQLQGMATRSALNQASNNIATQQAGMSRISPTTLSDKAGRQRAGAH